MPGAGVEGDIEVRIILARHRGRQVRGLGQPVEIDPPALDHPRQGEVQHFMRPFAYRRRMQQGMDVRHGLDRAPAKAGAVDAAH